MNEIYEQFLAYSKYEFAGNTLPQYLIAFGVFLLSLIVFKLISAILFRQIQKITAKTKFKWDDVLVKLLKNNSSLLIWVGSLCLALQFIHVHPKFQNTIAVFLVAVLGFVVIRIVQGILNFWFQKKYFEVEEVAVSKKSVMKNILLFIKVALWMVVVLFILDNLGFNITTAIAGLGIGGMALALASQSILSDVFSYFTIFFDKPFEVGDFIVIGEDMGEVEHVGVKTTRIRSLSGEQLVYGNSELIKNRIKNFKKMQKRRVCSKLSVVYETDKEKLQKIPGLIQKMIVQQEGVTFDRSHFKNFGAYSLDFEYVYYVLSSEYNDYMDLQQTINYAIFGAFAKEGITFAYPTQMVHLEKTSPSLK